MVGRMLATVSCTGLFLLVAMGFVASQPQEISQHFDTSQTVALSGTVATVILQDLERTFLMLDVPAGPGKPERWAVQGSAASQLGWGPRTMPVRPGVAVTVIVYRARQGANMDAYIPADHAGLLEAAKAGRLVHGTEMTLPDGQKVAFGEH